MCGGLSASRGVLSHFVVCAPPHAFISGHFVTEQGSYGGNSYRFPL